jgi:flagellar biosynthesis GTPase FlhF
MSAIATTSTPPSILSLSADTLGEIAKLNTSLAEFATTEITDSNFAAANAAVAKSAKIKKAIEAEAKERKRKIDAQKKLVDAAVESALGELTAALKPINQSLAAYAARKEEERQAAIAEARRIEAEERARKAEEARIAAEARAAQARREAEARAEAVRQAEELRRIELARQAALKAGEPLPPKPIEVVTAAAAEPDPWDVPEPTPAIVPEVVCADLGRVTPVARPVIPAAVKTAVRTRTVQKLEIFDESAIPAIALNGAVLRKVDNAAVTAALKAGINVPGARLVSEELTYNA